MSAFEVLTMGRIGVDVYPLQVGVALRGRRRRSASSSAAARPTSPSPPPGYGRRAAVITRTGDDPFGEFLHDALRGFGVDDRFVTAGAGPADAGHVLRDLPAGRLPAVLLPLARRRPTWRSAPSELDLDAIRDGRASSGSTGTGLSAGAEPRRATLAALDGARRPGGITVLDLDYRPMFWPSREEARAPGAARRCRT